MKNILVFDDKPQIRDFLEESLRSETTKLLTYHRVYDVDAYFNTKGFNIDGIILDIMMPSVGLNDEERKLTNGGVLTGWVWLWKHWISKSMQEHPLKEIPVIIYTAYEGDYNNYIDNLEPNGPEWAFANSKNVTSIPKNSNDDDTLARMRKHLDL